MTLTDLVLNEFKNNPGKEYTSERMFIQTAAIANENGLLDTHTPNATIGSVIYKVQKDNSSLITKRKSSKIKKAFVYVYSEENVRREWTKDEIRQVIREEFS